MGFQNENEQLRCQLKLFHIQSELTKEHYLKANHMLPIQSPSQQQVIHSHHHQQQQQHQQPQLQQQLKNNPNKSPNNILAASQHFQNILLMQQQQQQSHKSQELQSAAAAAVQTFPQFFLNHYVPTLNHRQNQQPNINITSDQMTSTPKKSNSFISNSSYSSPNSSTSSNNNSFNNSKMQANLNTNSLMLSLAAKCEPTHHSSTTV